MAERSQVIIFNNNTSTPLHLEDHDLTDGAWIHRPTGDQGPEYADADWSFGVPGTIAPGARVAWGSESDNTFTPLTLFGVASGTEGYARYSLPAQNGIPGDVDHVFLHWNVPWIGTASVDFVVIRNLTDSVSILNNFPNCISQTHEVERVGHGTDYYEQGFWNPVPLGPGGQIFGVSQTNPWDELSLTAIGSALGALTVNFVVPPILSWVSNDPNVARVVFNPVAPIPVDVALISDDPAVIGVPPTVKITSSGTINLNVPQQSGTFTSETVHLTASFAGQQIKRPVKVVRPENLPLPSLIIAPIGGDDPCSKHFIATTSQSFYVANPNVIHDSTGLTYKWTVTGAAAPQTDQPTLTIPSLPAAGTDVTIVLEIKNTYGIHAKGTLGFTATSGQYTLDDMIRELQCRVSRYKAINKYIPPWTPVELGDPAVTNRRLASLETQTKQQIEAGKDLIESIEKIRTAIQER